MLLVGTAAVFAGPPLVHTADAGTCGAAYRMYFTWELQPRFEAGAA